MSDQELEVEEVVEGTGMVGGTYRLLATGPSSLTSYMTDVESGEEVSDIEVSIELKCLQPLMKLILN